MWNASLLHGPILIPVLAAWFTSRSSRPYAAHRIALSAALASLLCTTIMAASGSGIEKHGWTLPLVHAEWHLGTDALIAPFLVLVCVITVAVLVALPSMDPRACTTLLLTLAFTLGMMESLDLVLIASFWVASIVPSAIELRRADSQKSVGHVFEVYAVLGACAMIAGAVVFGFVRSRAGHSLPFDLSVPTEGIALRDQHAVLVLVFGAVMVRKAIIPFHSWLPLVIERGPTGIVSLIAGSHMGAVLILRILPFTRDAATTDFPVLAAIALTSALYAALVALGQREIRRALGFIATSQLAFVVVGLAEARTESVHGALLQIVTTGLTLTGLLIITSAVEVRAGTHDIARLGGLASRFPRMSVAFLLLGLSAIGMPGTLAFVAEDLLLHGLLHTHPVIATLLLVTTVLNGITLLRLFLQGFLGPSRDPERIGARASDLGRRESAAVFAIVIASFALGILPRHLIEMRSDAVERWVDDPSGSPQ